LGQEARRCVVFIYNIAFRAILVNTAKDIDDFLPLPVFSQRRGRRPGKRGPASQFRPLARFGIVGYDLIRFAEQVDHVPRPLGGMIGQGDRGVPEGGVCLIGIEFPRVLQGIVVLIHAAGKNDAAVGKRGGGVSIPGCGFRAARLQLGPFLFGDVKSPEVFQHFMVFCHAAMNVHSAVVIPDALIPSRGRGGVEGGYGSPLFTVIGK